MTWSSHHNGTSRAHDPRAVIYARVSSKEQQEGGFSIPAQLKLLRGYALSEGFSVAKEFTDAETAKISGRTAFKEMLVFLKRSSCRVILVEKTDRLYRNFKDWVTVDDLDLEIHLVKEGVILSPDSKSHEKFIHGIKVLMAKNYTDNLSEEVKKGMTEKAEQGHWPSCAHIGYTNNRDTHRIEPDPVKAPLIVQLFEDAADPRMTLKKLSERTYKRGLRSRRSQDRITVEGIRRILRNPIYWGPFHWRGKVYLGNHEPLISRDLFEEVQLTLRAKGKPHRSKHDFAFRGLATCRCGKRLVGHLAKGRYRYYGCSARCGIPQIKESKLSEMFLEHLKAIKINKDVAEWLLTAIKEFDAKRQGEREQTLARHQERQRQIQKTIDSAYDDKLSGRITEEYWVERFNRWQEELASVRAEIRDLEGATFDSFKKADALIKLCRKAPRLYELQTPDEQARIIKLITSNFSWNGVTLTPRYRKPFDMLAEGLLIMDGGANGVLKQNFQSFIQTLDRLPMQALNDQYAGLVAA